MRFDRLACFTLVLLTASVQGGFAQEVQRPSSATNVACAWSLLKMVQLFESACRPGEQDAYRAALDEAVERLENRAREWQLPDIDRALESAPSLITKEIAKDPTQCTRGELFNMAHFSRSRGVGPLRDEVSKLLAVPFENQGNACL
jgi:hypothetical protein